MSMSFKNSKELVEVWVNAVNEKQLDCLLGMYAEDSILLPTFSPHTIRTLEGRRDYFERLATRKGLNVFLHERTLRVVALDSKYEVASGIYRWSFEIDDEPLGFEARFTYCVDLSRSSPIVHHHSSQIPRTLS
jgi:hypothetical protein